MDNIWYLSPSNQAGNIGVNGYGSEKEQMNLLLDEIIPHLDRAGVSFHRGDPDITIQQRVAESNSMKSCFHLALHSNAGGSGKARGPIAFYYSEKGKTFCKAVVDALLKLGQASNRAQNVQQSKSLYELRCTNAPACLLEVDFHDSVSGVEFLTTRRSEIAETIATVIIEADGKVFVPVTAGEYADEAVKLGLFPADTRWNTTLSKEEAATLVVKVLNLCKRG
jgi:N-acetylmuramoyl-L-alanine amidase